MKKQATILALRFVSDEYWAPLGVWVVRQAVKNTMKNTPIKFNTREEMLKYAFDYIKKFGYDLGGFMRQSVLVQHMNTQKKISDY